MNLQLLTFRNLKIFFFIFLASLICLPTTSSSEQPINHPPVMEPIGNKVVNEGSLLQFGVNAVDPDGGKLTYSAPILPKGALFDADNHTFSWTPPYHRHGSYNATFCAFDGELYATSTINITVLDVNRLQAATAIYFDPNLPNGNNGWYKSIPYITLVPNTLSTTYYQWNSMDSWNTYSEPIQALEGVNGLYYYSENNIDAEEINYQELLVDSFKPITIAPRRSIVKKRRFTSLWWKVVDPYTESKAEVYIKIRKKGKTYCLIYYGFTDINQLRRKIIKVFLPRGKYKYFVYAKDQAGNSQKNIAYNFLFVR